MKSSVKVIIVYLVQLSREFILDKEALILSSRWSIQQIKVWYKTRFIHLYKGCYEILKSMFYIVWSLTLLLLSPVIVIYLSFSLIGNGYKEIVSKYNKTGIERIEKRLNRSEGFIMKRIVKIMNGDKND